MPTASFPLVAGTGCHAAVTRGVSSPGEGAARPQLGAVQASSVRGPHPESLGPNLSLMPS